MRSRFLPGPIRNLIEGSLHDPDKRKAASAKAVETTFEIIKQPLESGEDDLISGFGKFCVKDKGKRLVLAERRVVTFSCSPVLKRKLDDAELGDMPFVTANGGLGTDEEMGRRTIETARFVFAFSFYALSPERVMIQDHG